MSKEGQVRGSVLGYQLLRTTMITQYFHSKRGCLSYITHDETTREALIIDPSSEIKTEEYLEYINKNQLTLKYIIETHTHADHISSCSEIRNITGARIIRSTHAPSKSADIYVDGGEKLQLGESHVSILYTPGHTNESISVYTGKEVFTGDTLLIGGTGRTDFQVGNSDDLYDSLHNTLGDLPHHTLVRPGHNYKGVNTSTIGDEMHTNERLSLCRSAFVDALDNHHPPKPDLFDISISTNSQ